MTELRAGELTDAEIAEVWNSIDFGQFNTLSKLLAEGRRTIATAAYEKAMKRAAEICKSGEHYPYRWDECAAAIERELRG